MAARKRKDITMQMVSTSVPMAQVAVLPVSGEQPKKVFTSIELSPAERAERIRKAHADALKQKRRNDRGQRVLIKNLRKRRKELEKLLEYVNSHWEYEDIVYRLYHGSYKTVWAMALTEKILKELKGLYRYGFKNCCSEFKLIMEQGLDKKKDPRKWIEAMFHARYALEMAVKYSKEVKKPLQLLPPGYASLLYLYGLR